MKKQHKKGKTPAKALKIAVFAKTGQTRKSAAKELGVPLDDVRRGLNERKFTRRLILALRRFGYLETDDESNGSE